MTERKDEAVTESGAGLPRVGSLMSNGKAKKNDWHEFAAYCKEEGLLEVLFLKDDMSIEELHALRLDAIIGKFTDLLVKEDEHSQQVLAKYERYMEESGVAAVDSMNAQRSLISREALSHTLNGIDWGDLQVRNPRFAVIRERSEFGHGLRYPVVVKSIQACGSADSHEMGIINSAAGLELPFVQLPVLVQEFVNHNGTIFKVFVIGHEVSVVRRHSIANIPSDSDKPVLFNSQHMQDIMDLSSHASETPPSPEVLQKLADKISDHSGLSYYGFDLIRDCETGDLAVIDVNFFPGYKGVERVFEKTAKLFLDRIAAAKAAKAK